MPRKGLLMIVAAITCVGQEGPQLNRHLDRDLQGPRLDVDAESSHFVGAPNGVAVDSASGLISVKRLSHKIPRQARQAFDRATKYSENEDYRSAANELQKALSIDADFVEARANLGAQYIRLGLLDQAESELLRAAEAEPRMAAICTNLAIVYLREGKDSAAVEYGQRAVRLDPSSYRAHYALGLAMMRFPAFEAEAARHLRIAKDGKP